MTIDPISQHSIPKIALNSSGQNTRKVAAPETHPSASQNIERYNDLMRKLEDIPDVRPEMVARAKSLLDDSGYPPDPVVEAMSGDILAALEGKME